MLTNYFKIAFRSIFRDKLTAFINFGGLALAMTCAVLIGMYVADELCFDKYNSKAGKTYRITRDFLSNDGSINLQLANVAPPIGPLIKNDFGEVAIMARTLNSGYVIGLEENGEMKKMYSEDNLYTVEPDILKIFDFNITAGNPATALERPFTVMLSAKTAAKYFGDQNPVGRRLRAGNQYDLEVTGVYDDLPFQSHWHPDLMLSFSTLNDSTVYGIRGLESNWGNNSFGTYIMLEPGADPAKMEASLPAFLDKHYGPYAIANFGAPATFVASKTTTLHVQKLTDIHLRSHLADELEAGGNINNVYLMSVIGVFIVLIACFNFINLSTARATKRAKEVGMRKVVGAARKQLITQYLSESVLITVISVTLAIGLSLLSLQWLNQFTGKHLTLDLTGSHSVLPGLMGFAIVVGILAGVYPAFIISSYKPALVLKSQQGTGAGRSGIRKVLVVAQFVISIVLIIATAVTSQQLGFLNSQDLGYSRDQVVLLPYYGELSDSYDAFHQELTKSSLIKNVARSSRTPTGRLLDSYGGASILKDGSLVQSNVSLKTVVVDEDFFDTYNIPLAAGRPFSRSIPTDDSLAFIVNVAAAKAFGWTDLEKEVNNDFVYNRVQGKLIGITKDFHFESMHQPIAPMVFLVYRSNYNAISVKISGADTKGALALLESKWKQFLPKQPFDFQFLDERYQRLYDSEQKQNQLFTIFSGLAIFIACLGLFGLATFNTLLRVKEIGIRKVLGASVPSILALLSREVVILVVIANVVAWPVAWYMMSWWLGSFAYHIDMNPAIYILAAAIAIIVALITVSSQTIRAARRNPTQTLRYE